MFKLKDGVTSEQLLGTVDAVSDWIKTQPGFISRELSYSSKDGQWIEVVWWENLAAAEAAANLAVSSTACAPMFSLIDSPSVLMLHGMLAKPPVSH